MVAIMDVRYLCAFYRYNNETVVILFQLIKKFISLIYLTSLNIVGDQMTSGNKHSQKGRGLNQDATGDYLSNPHPKGSNTIILLLKCELASGALVWCTY